LLYALQDFWGIQTDLRKHRQIYGHGKQTRSFQYVSDLVDGLVALMNSSYTLPVNIGNPVEHTIDGKFFMCFPFVNLIDLSLFVIHLSSEILSV